MKVEIEKKKSSIHPCSFHTHFFLSSQAQRSRKNASRLLWLCWQNSNFKLKIGNWRCVTSWRRATGRRLWCSFCGIHRATVGAAAGEQGGQGGHDGWSLCLWHFNPFLCFCPSNTSDSRALAPWVRRRECRGPTPHYKHVNWADWRRCWKGRSATRRFPQVRIENCLRITEICTKSVLPRAAWRISWMCISQEQTCRALWVASVGDLTSCFQAPGWSPSRTKQPSGLTAIFKSSQATGCFRFLLLSRWKNIYFCVDV